MALFTSAIFAAPLPDREAVIADLARRMRQRRDLPVPLATAPTHAMHVYLADYGGDPGIASPEAMP